MNEYIRYLDEDTEAVIFDLGNVLLGYDWKTYLSSFGYDETTAKRIADAVFLNEDWERGDKGGITAAQWESLFVENAPDLEKEIRQVFSGIDKTIYPLPYTDRLIRLMKRNGLKLYYLSNYSEHLHQITKQHMGFLEHFDGGIFSYEVLCIKPDEKIYQMLLEQYSIVPEHTVFFDDRKVNVDAAKKLGLKGIVFDPDMAYHMLDKKIQ